jgi:hypothetical protein
MGTEKQNQRVCKYCESKFTLTKRQLRQQRKAVYCSRTCARKDQHRKNHADIRSEKSCETCGHVFRVANWDRSKRFCSAKCSARARFGNPNGFDQKAKEKLERMVKDQKYAKWLESKAKSYGSKYGVDWRDLLQEFLLSIAEGKTAKFEHVFYGAIRSEYKRGITGSHNAVEVFGGDEIFQAIRDNRRSMSEYEFAEYLADLRRVTTDDEYKLACMFLLGFDKGEIFDHVGRKNRREIAALWKRLGIQGRIKNL